MESIPSLRRVETRSAHATKPFDSDTGEIRVGYDRLGTKCRRFMAQAGSRKLMPKTSVANCLRAPVKGADHIPVYKSISQGSSHFGNLQTCSSVWACPCCAAKISERRRVELKQAIAQASVKGSVSLVTFTFSHKRNDQLKRLRTCLQKAYGYMTAQRSYKKLLSDFGIYGTVRAFEITWSESNGWHPHFHVLWFSENTLSDDDNLTIKTRLFKLWHSAAIKHKLGAPSPDHGVDVRNGNYAANYGSKWGLDQEMTKGHIKMAKGDSCTPFELLEIYSLEDHKRAGALFVEFASTFKGARQLVWSKGLKSRFKIESKTDEEISSEHEDNAVLLGRLSLNEWRLICENEGRGTVSALAETGGWKAIQAYVTSLRKT